MVDNATDELMNVLKENWLTILEDGTDGKYIQFAVLPFLISFRINFVEDKNEETMEHLAERMFKAESDYFAKREILEKAVSSETSDAFEKVIIFCRYQYYSNYVTNVSDLYFIVLE